MAQCIDGSIVRAHQHSSGAVGNENQAIGKSVGGNTTKIHMAVDACGFPIEFDLTGGEVRLYRNSRGCLVNAGPRPSLHPVCRLGLGPTIKHTTAIPEEPFFLSTRMEVSSTCIH